MTKTRAETWQREVQAKIELTAVFRLIETWQCPNCPWFRARTNKEWWERTIILHPEYGYVPNYVAYKKDIENHDCREYLNARERCVQLFGTN